MEAAAAAGIQYKRGRGRPLGSKTKPKPDSNLPPAETPQEAAMRMLNNKKLSSKINYSALANLFSDDPEGEKAEEHGQEQEQEQQEREEQETAQEGTTHRQAEGGSTFLGPSSRQKGPPMSSAQPVRKNGSPGKAHHSGKGKGTPIQPAMLDALDVISTKPGPKKSALGFRPLGASTLPGGAAMKIQGRLGGLGDDVGILGNAGSRGTTALKTTKAPSLNLPSSIRQGKGVNKDPSVPSPAVASQAQTSKSKAKRKVRFAD